MTVQAQRSVTPTNAQTVPGQQVFVTHACVLCRTYRSVRNVSEYLNASKAGILCSHNVRDSPSRM